MPERPTVSATRPRALLIDAFGTILGLEPPVPRLASLLADAGHPFPEPVVARALAAEIAHYRANHLRGGDPSGLRHLRLDCAGVLARELGPDAPAPDALVPLLAAALRFTLLPDAPPLLAAAEAAGLPVALVSNWDMSLRSVLAGLGLADRFAAVCISAEVGVAKPDPALFACALDRLGCAPADAVHCGDDAVLDGVGARRAGARPVLVARDGTPCADGFTCIRDLRELIPVLLHT